MTESLFFQATWPALQRDAHGVIFVFNPDKENHARELDVFHAEFVGKQPAVADSQCVVFAYFREPEKRGSRGVNLCEYYHR